MPYNIEIVSLPQITVTSLHAIYTNNNVHKLTVKKFRAAGYCMPVLVRTAIVLSKCLVPHI